MGNVLQNQNNSMHFLKGGLLGNSYLHKQSPYQSETEEPNQAVKLNRKGSANTSLVDPLSMPLKKPQTPNAQVPSVRQSHSQPPIAFPTPSAFTVQSSQVQLVKSDNTNSSSAVVVMMSGGPTSDQPLSGNSMPLLGQQVAPQQVINLFRDDAE